MKKTLLLSCILAASASLIGCSEDTPKAPPKPAMSVVQESILNSLVLSDWDTFSSNYESESFFKEAIRQKYNFTVVAPRVISNAYKNNELAADKKYKGKFMIIKGCLIDDIDKTLDQVSVTCRIGRWEIVGNPFLVMRENKATEENLANVNKGETHDFFCKGDGTLLGGPVLRECRFVYEVGNETFDDVKNMVFSRPGYAEVLKKAEEAMPDTLKKTCQENFQECHAALQKSKYKVVHDAVKMMEQQKQGAVDTKK